MVTAPQSRSSYPPVLNTAIDESSISLALGIEDDVEDCATSVGHVAEKGPKGPQESTGPGTPCHSLPRKDAEFRHLDVTLPEDEQFGECDWTQSVLMAAQREPRW